MAPAQVRRHLKGVALRRQHERAARMDLAWHIQAMAPERSRNGRMPDHAKLVAGEKHHDRKRGQTPEQMREAMIGIVHAFGGKIIPQAGPRLEHIRLPT